MDTKEKGIGHNMWCTQEGCGYVYALKVIYHFKGNLMAIRDEIQKV